MPATRHANQTAARHLLSVVEEAGEDRKIGLAFDVYIKARSFALLNKTAFVAAVIGIVLLILWPAFVVAGIWADGVLGNPVAQTALTALTGFAIFIYSHYKKKQMLTENLLRMVAFSDKPVNELSALIVQEMPKIDIGVPLGDAAKDGGSG